MKILRTELQPSYLLPNLTSGLVIGLLEVVLSISFAALIFSGELSEFLANGLGLALFGSIVICLIIALLSSFPGMVGGLQDVPAAILAVVAASIAASMPEGATSQESFLTAVAAIALTTTITGIFFLGLGQFKLASLIRFLPYPVVGGFLAGTGWLLVSGALGLMAGIELSWATLPQLFAPDILIQWLPGLGFALLVLLLTNRFDHHMLLPGAVIGGTALFFAAMAVAGLSINELSDQGWFLGPFPTKSFWTPLSLADANLVNWAVIGGQATNAATILFVSAIALLLNVSALELTANRDIDLDHELRMAGIGNIVAGLGSGLVGYHQFSTSALNVKLGSASRLVALVAAAICLLVLIWGASVLAFFPKVIVGGLLLFLGLALLQEWTYQAWFKFPRVDYALIILILLAIVTIGFLEGVALGIGAAVIKFVLRYSQTESVRHELSGSSYQSRVTRSPEHRKMLDEIGHKLYIAQLQGFIFFGTADKLLNRIRRHLEATEIESTQFVTLDFRRVTGLDSTALLSFRKLQQFAIEHHMTLVLTEVNPGVKQQLIRGGLDEGGAQIYFFADLDLGVEWCENRLLEQSGLPLADSPIHLSQQLAHLLPESTDLAQLFQYLEPQTVAAGEEIMRQGAEPEFLFFVESGQVTAQLERPNRPAVRLETMRNGRVVGELGFYLNQARTASIIADEPTVLYKLSREAFQRLEQEHPETASTLHRIIVHLLAERVTHLVTTVNALQK